MPDEVEVDKEKGVVSGVACPTRVKRFTISNNMSVTEAVETKFVVTRHILTKCDLLACRQDI